MFGSLVLALPTHHTGGALVFRHQGREWTVDAGKDLARATSQHVVAYAAFFSDVEHEVLPVTSGNRVTITYNLHWVGDDGASSKHHQLDAGDDVAALSSQADADNALRAALERVLADPAFLPHGGWMGFGLRHQYRNDAAPSANELKGADAALSHVLSSLGSLAHPVTKVIYNSVQHYDYEDRPAGTFMFDGVPNADYQVEDFMELISWQKQLQQIGGKPEDLANYDPYNHREKKKEVPNSKKEFKWVTELTKEGRQNVPYVAYGNQASLSTFYVDVCLVVEVGPLGARKVEPVDG